MLRWRLMLPKHFHTRLYWLAGLLEPLEQAILISFVIGKEEGAAGTT